MARPTTSTRSTPAPSGKSGAVPQGDLFLLDSPLHGEIRGER